MNKLDKIRLMQLNFEEIDDRAKEAKTAIGGIERVLEDTNSNVKEYQESAVRSYNNDEVVNEEAILEAFDESSNFSYLLYKATGKLEEISQRVQAALMEFEYMREEVNEFETESIDALSAIRREGL